MTASLITNVFYSPDSVWVVHIFLHYQFIFACAADPTVFDLVRELHAGFIACAGYGPHRRPTLHPATSFSSSRANGTKGIQGRSDEWQRRMARDKACADKQWIRGNVAERSTPGRERKREKVSLAWLSKFSLSALVRKNVRVCLCVWGSDWAQDESGTEPRSLSADLVHFNPHDEINFTFILFGIPESPMPYMQNTNGIIILKSFLL